jgi:beta-lactamase regulating signal transducer with metallopeptidase domain
MSILEHLWQSTLCAGVAGLLAIALRRSSAGTRHAIWLAASLKFLVPLSLFVAAGAYLAAGTASVTTSRVTMAIRWLDQSQPFWTIDVTRVPSGTIALALAQVDPLALILIWAAGAAALVVWRWRQCREASRLARSSIPLDHDREAQALRRVADHSRISRPIDLRLCQADGDSRARDESRESQGQSDCVDPHGRGNGVLVPPARLVDWRSTDQ